MKKFISQPNFFRLFSYLVVIITLGFLINNILINFLNINNKNLNQIIYGLSVILPFIIILYFNKRTLIQDSNLLTSISLYIAKAAFWIVLIIGITDFIISFLVSEKFIEIFFQALILLYRRVMYELIFFTINLNKKTKQLQISLDLYFLEYLFAD